MKYKTGDEVYYFGLLFRTRRGEKVTIKTTSGNTYLVKFDNGLTDYVSGHFLLNSKQMLKLELDKTL